MRNYNPTETFIIYFRSSLHSLLAYLPPARKLKINIQLECTPRLPPPHFCLPIINIVMSLKNVMHILQKDSNRYNLYINTYVMFSSVLHYITMQYCYYYYYLLRPLIMMALNISLCKHEYFMAAVFLSVITCVCFFVFCFRYPSCLTHSDLSYGKMCFVMSLWISWLEWKQYNDCSSFPAVSYFLLKCPLETSRRVDINWLHIPSPLVKWWIKMLLLCEYRTIMDYFTWDTAYSRCLVSGSYLYWPAEACTQQEIL